MFLFHLVFPFLNASFGKRRRHWRRNDWDDSFWNPNFNQSSWRAWGEAQGLILQLLILGMVSTFYFSISFFCIELSLNLYISQIMIIVIAAPKWSSWFEKHNAWRYFYMISSHGLRWLASGLCCHSSLNLLMIAPKGGKKKNENQIWSWSIIKLWCKTWWQFLWENFDWIDSFCLTSNRIFV